MVDERMVMEVVWDVVMLVVWEVVISVEVILIV